MSGAGDVTKDAFQEDIISEKKDEHEKCFSGTSVVVHLLIVAHAHYGGSAKNRVVFRI